ncbi:MAG: type II toxin-antitoxin system death-on-curing family toxin [Promethearchaeota archaeon]|nr:MAG: type II toxin-antitoxin system death-on-curing family toxin [Candidatus Lokiarchaeota archaeon]
MEWVPSVEYIETLLEDQIKAGHLMNRQGLISTLDKVKWGIPFQDIPTIWDKVTILYKEIIENHYFSDGNKRIGSLLAYIFLFKNGYEFSPPVGEIYRITMEVAQGLKKFDEIKEWFKTNSKKEL